MQVIPSPEDLQKEIIRHRVQKLKKYYTHVIIFGIALVLYLLKTYCNAPLHFIPLRWLNQFVILCWAFVVFIETLQIIFVYKIFNANWELNKINQILEKENQSKKRWK